MSSHKKQCKKESDPFTLTEEQCRVIILLVKETVKPAEILHRLSAQRGEETLSHAGVYDWCNIIQQMNPTSFLC
jgi:IS30 family transposase